MQEPEKQRSKEARGEKSPGWIRTNGNSNSVNKRTERFDLPIPKPNTELGFTGISHKISGHSLTSGRRPAQQ